MMEARKPIAAPSARIGSTLTKSFEARKRILSGSRWIQLCWPGLRSVAVWPLLARRSARTLSTIIRLPTMPRKAT